MMMPLSFTVQQSFQTKEAARAEVADINSARAPACIRVTAASMGAFALLVAFSYIAFGDRLTYLQPEERATAALAATALTTSLVLRIIMHVSQSLVPDADTTRSRSTSGVLCLSHCANAVAAVTSWIFALAPVPTLIDPFTGCRVHMLRWCEWTVLAFVMTFMIDVADKSKAWTAVMLAASQSASTFCGYLLPLCASQASWGALVTLSFVFFAALAPKWLQRRRLCREAHACADAARDSAEHADAASLAARIDMSFYLLSACCVAWSGFVFVFFAHAGARFTGVDTRDAPVWPFVLDAVIDVGAKLVYAAIIVDMHGALYDSATQRSALRLKELQSIVAIVWSASSDTLAVSERHVGGGRSYVDTAVSPTADMLLGQEAGGTGCGWGAPWPYAESQAAETHAGSPADILAVRFSYRDGEPAGPLVRSRALWQPSVHRREAMDGCDDDSRCQTQPSAAEASGFAELIRRAWLLKPEADVELRLTHDLFRADGVRMQVEAKVTRIGSWRLVVVVRDITERVMVFEAEKALVKQATAHERDAAANRFTRHEVKNGLLSAIGLVDTLQELSGAPAAHAAAPAAHVVCGGAPVALVGGGGAPGRLGDSYGGRGDASNRDDTSSLDSSSRSDVPRVAASPRSAVADELARCVAELKTTLMETLNSVLSETMARELVYDAYSPVPVLVDVVALLKGHATGVGGSQSSRFKIEMWPAEIPFLVLDPQLLHCIHRNAVSNASKYGDPLGEVLTRLCLVRPDGTNVNAAELDSSSAVGREYTLTLEVFNEPGPDHERLLDASGVALHDKVFAQGQRLHPDLRCANAAASTVSSGDGGWIMRKCARALGGDCHIEFNAEGTILTMTCPITVGAAGARPAMWALRGGWRPDEAPHRASPVTVQHKRPYCQISQ
ncbi:hypothetical protein M885DRAFT_623342 [Pelagophyceae sp. CCMP2097]|nr:hypothetical protein M885DRAFT_623342 [Pelagophyceae sp. CCMP2097]